MKASSCKLGGCLFVLAVFPSYCSSQEMPEGSSSSNHETHLDESLGLNHQNVRHNEISIGFLPAFGEPIAPNTPQDINAKLPAPMAIMGDYVELNFSNPEILDLDKHLAFHKSLSGNPVWEMAVMPNAGIEFVTPEVSDRVAKKMKWLNDQGITVWLRFAHEMNGDWYQWGGKPELFLEKWRMVVDAVKSQTSKTYMLWAPNSEFGSLNDTRGGYIPYWPGEKYVDIVGLSFYHYGGVERLNTLPTPGEAKTLIRRFTDLYATPYNLPFVLSETGASYTRSLQTGQPAEGGASENDIKLQWLQQLLSDDLRRDVPLFKAFSWFEVIKNENAAGDTPVKSEDFRLLLGNQTISENALRLLSQQAQ